MISPFAQLKFLYVIKIIVKEEVHQLRLLGAFNDSLFWRE